MKRMWVVVAMGLAIAGMSGCTPTPDSPAPEVISEWIDQRGSEEIPGALATLAGIPTSDADSEEEGIVVDFETPVRIDELEFSCFGAEAMSVNIVLTGTDTVASSRSEELACVDSPHLLDDAVDDATKVSATGVAEDGFGAWSVIVHGTK